MSTSKSIWSRSLIRTIRPTSSSSSTTSTSINNNNKSSSSPSSSFCYVAIILGHLGITEEQLSHYAKTLYVVDTTVKNNNTDDNSNDNNNIDNKNAAVGDDGGGSSSYNKFRGGGCRGIAVTAASPPGTFAMNGSLRMTALATLEEATKAIREITTTDTVSAAVVEEEEEENGVSSSRKKNPTTTRKNFPLPPLIIHLFSNGGAFILEEIEVLLQQHKERKERQQSNDDDDDDDDDEAYKEGMDIDLDLIAECHSIGYQFFDSCPCYIRPIWNVNGITCAFPNPSWSIYGRTIYATMASLALTTWCAITLSLHRPGRFWYRMMNASSCQHQIYAYTTKDMASDAYRIDELIQYRRSRCCCCCCTNDDDDNNNNSSVKNDIVVYRYDDSNHCQLLRDHPMEYRMAVAKGLEAAMERWKQQQQQ